MELGRAGVALTAIAVVNPALPTDHLERWAQVGCPILVSVGLEDPLAPHSLINTVTAHLQAAHADWQLVVHGGAEHAFHLPPLNPDGSVAADASQIPSTPGVSYHQLHAQRAWRVVLAHLEEAFAMPTRHAHLESGC